jgi:hypothetical protein
VVSTLAGVAGTFGSFDGTNGAARFNCPVGVTVKASGNIFVTDYNNHTIRQVTPAGVVSTLAGWAGIWGSADGMNSSALFFAPAGITVDSSTNIYVADSGNNAVRKIAPSGSNWVVTTVAGLAGVSGSTDGTGTGALFYHPAGITVNSAGYLFAADSGNNTIRTSEALAALTWTNPIAIAYGTALSAIQLNATANVAGSFAYNPVSGTVLNAGTSTLSVLFTPTDAVNNRGASASVSQLVTLGSLTVTAADARRLFGVTNPIFSGTITGLQNSDNITATYSSSATNTSPAGAYPIVPSLMDPGNRQTNYIVSLVNGILSVVTTPTIQSATKSGNSFTFTFNTTSNQTYQIQYRTNLIQGTWSNLGGVITANNSTAGVSDTISTPQKFYRVILWP